MIQTISFFALFNSNVALNFAFHFLGLRCFIIDSPRIWNWFFFFFEEIWNEISFMCSLAFYLHYQEMSVFIYVHILFYPHLQFITTFSVVGSMKKQFYAENEDLSRWNVQYLVCSLTHPMFQAHPSVLKMGNMVCTSSRKDDPKIEELFDTMEKIKDEYEAIERPTLEIETANRRSPQRIPQGAPSSYLRQIMPEYKPVTRDAALDREAELLELESEFVRSCQNHSSDEISDWVCDEFERWLKTWNWLLLQPCQKFPADVAYIRPSLNQITRLPASPSTAGKKSSEIPEGSQLLS